MGNRNGSADPHDVETVSAMFSEAAASNPSISLLKLSIGRDVDAQIGAGGDTASLFDVQIGLQLAIGVVVRGGEAAIDVDQGDAARFYGETSPLPEMDGIVRFEGVERDNADRGAGTGEARLHQRGHVVIGLEILRQEIARGPADERVGACCSATGP